MFSNEKKNQSKDGKGSLMNTSEISRHLAAGSVTAIPYTTKKEDDTIRASNFNMKLFFSLSNFYSLFLSRWGGAGGEDLVKRDCLTSHNNESKQKVATSKPEPCVLSFLNVLCFATKYVQTGWAIIQSNIAISNHLRDMVDVGKRYRYVS